MPVQRTTIELDTRGDFDVHDITHRVARHVADSRLSSGVGVVFVPGATGAITTIEHEPGCLADLERLFDEIAPVARNYAHHERWGDGNGHSHLRAALLGPSLAFPFADGAPSLGTWQQIIFIDFDNRPRTRSLIVQLVGE